MSTPTPGISVIMAVYNGAAYLHHAVQSILQQSFTDFEFLIVNDGSTDETTEILKSYQLQDTRIKVIHQANQGLVASLNHACSLAQGKYLARMDADDFSLPNRFQLQRDYLDQYPKCAVVGSFVQPIDEHNTSVGKPITYPQSSPEIKRQLQSENALAHPSAMLRRECFQQVGGYRPLFVAAQDYDLWLRMSERWDLTNLPEVLLNYRYHEHQATVGKSYEKRLLTLIASKSATLRRKNQADPVSADTTLVTDQLLTTLDISPLEQDKARLRATLSIANRLLKSNRIEQASDYLLGISRSKFSQNLMFNCFAQGKIAHCRCKAYKLSNMPFRATAQFLKAIPGILCGFAIK